MDIDSKIKTKKKFKIIIYGAIITGLLIFFIQFLFLSKSKAEKELEEITSMMNNSCPHALDDETLVESVYTSSKNKVGLNIVLPKISRSIFQTEFFKDSIYSSIKRQMKADDFFKPLYEKDVTIIFNYYDKNPKLLFEINLKTDQYK